MVKVYILCLLCMLSEAQKMAHKVDCAMTKFSNLGILAFLLATIIILSSWDPSNLFFTVENPFMPKDELQASLQRASMGDDKTVIITIINEAYVETQGNEYPSMLDIFLESFWVGEGTMQLVDRLLVVAMDKTAQERCRFRGLNCYRLVEDDSSGGGGDDRFAREKVFMSDEFIEMMWRRTFFLLNVLKKGFNFIFTDTDILWLRSPFTRVSNNDTLDFEISSDFYTGNPYSESNHINTGFYFIRSNEKTIKLFQTWYDMRKNSTGLKEQDVLGNLIGSGILRKLGMKTVFLNTLYFSGFCRNSEDVGLVVTVHANCCRSIRAKVVDLKATLGDWKRFKNERNYKSSFPFQWSNHTACMNSWRKRNTSSH